MMLRPVLALLIAIAGLVPLAQAATPAPDPRFKVPRAQLLTTVKSVGVLPVFVPELVTDADGVARRLEAEVLAHLAPAGFELVPPQAMRELQERAKATLGGLYDPMTGRADDAKIRAYREYVFNEYRQDHPVDAWLRVRVVERMAPTVNGTANWDGVADSSTGRTGFVGYMVSGATSGRLPVLSLQVQLQAADGRVLYESLGGLQVLRYVKALTGNVQMPDVDPAFIMRDPARDERALGIALDPLARGEPAKTRAEPAPAPVASTATGAAGRLSREELLARFHRLGLAPLQTGASGAHAETAARYAELLRRRLTELGFEVVAADEFTTRWQEALAAAGGFYDPYTGRADESKRRELRAKVVAALGQALEVGAVLVPAVEPRRALYHGEYASWDGAKEQAAASKSGFAALFSPTFSGYVGALSLNVRCIDAQGAFLYEGWGGIQLTEHLDGQHSVAVPSSELFADPAKDEQAVQAALEPLEPREAAAAKPAASH